MREQDLEIIKNLQLFLKKAERSGEVVLADPIGGNMYLTFELRYVADGEIGKTNISSSDPHGAEVVIETKPNAITRPTEPIRLGTYENIKPLYLGFVVQPQIAQSGEHEVSITFYLEKGVADGSNN